MRTRPAHGKHSLRCGAWTLVGCGCGILRKPDPESYRTWKPDGISGEHGGSVMLRTGVCRM